MSSSLEQLASEAAKLGLELTPQQLELFASYEKDLYEANKVMNLTRIPQEEAWLKHFLDSLLIAPFIAPGSLVLDIGTGPGLPAFPLACARPDIQVLAMDSSGKMLGFLETQLLPNLMVHTARAEECGSKEKFDFVTGRAVAPLGIQLELSSAPCKIGGSVVPMRTPHEQFELESLRRLGLELEKVETKALGQTNIVRAFPIYRKVAKSEAGLPRKWAEIKKAPLG